MKALENLAIDIFDDNNVISTMKKIATEIPEELRGIDLPTNYDRNKLDDTQFALSIITKTASRLNKFPINDKLNTSLSNEYFDLNHSKLPAEAQKVAATYIKMACDRFGIEPKETTKTAASRFPVMANIYIEKLTDKAAGQIIMKKEANEHKRSEHYYALTKTAGDGQVNRSYAMPTPNEVEKAAVYFEKFAKQFAPEDRHTFASNVVKRAVELGIDVDNTMIQKYAGLSFNADVDAYLSTRKSLVEDRPEFVEALTKLASHQGQTDPTTFARVLHEFDKRAGLTRYYDKYLADPYASTFGVPTTKTASALYEIDGLQVKEGDIEKVANNKYDVLKSYFGSTLADGLKKEGSPAFLALPDDSKEVIARIINGEIQ